MKREIKTGWFMEFNPKPIPKREFDYDFWHTDHDGENGLCGAGADLDDCLRQIAEIEEQNHD